MSDSDPEDFDPSEAALFYSHATSRAVRHAYTNLLTWVRAEDARIEEKYHHQAALQTILEEATKNVAATLETAQETNTSAKTTKWEYILLILDVGITRCERLPSASREVVLGKEATARIQAMLEVVEITKRMDDEEEKKVLSLTRSAMDAFKKCIDEAETSHAGVGTMSISTSPRERLTKDYSS